MVKKFRRYVYSFWRDPRTWRTDRRTDTAWQQRPRLCIASRGKKTALDVFYWSNTDTKHRAASLRRQSFLLLITGFQPTHVLNAISVQAEDLFTRCEQIVWQWRRTAKKHAMYVTQGVGSSACGQSSQDPPSTLTHDIDIAILSVRLSVRDVPGLDENGLNIVIVFFHHTVA